ncbi:clathrin light chain isoform X4 [Sitophilus oryzae]|uniref:Clathrin light chain n=1 Tax=Sitophilus oryzae TaxID=7048 RepID=A0A6J2YJM1_SITOR|nr:clathrin light chain isoform X4 [Sitophilus oryzae]
MSGFGDNFDQGDVDPAAEFLAREQDELAGLEDEVKPAAVVSSTLANGDDPSNSAGSFEMVENFDQEIKKEQDIDFDKKETYNGSGISPPVSLHQPREEPETIKKWREEQVKRLEEKDREEEKKKEELREIAKKELEDWYKNHEEIIAKTKAANRNAEKQFVAEDDEIQPGTEWERIAKLCDFNPKAKPGSKDVSRMRSLILQMKQNPVQIKNKA